MSLLISCSDCSGAENCPLQEGGGWKEAQVELQGESLTLLESESFHIVWKWKFSHCWKVKVFTLFESESFHFAGKWKFSHWLKVKGFCIDGKWKFLHCLKGKVFALLKTESSWYCWKVNVLKLWILTTFEKKKDFFTIMEMKSFMLAGYKQGIPLACNLVVQGWRTPLLSRSPRHHHIKEVKSVVYTF